MMIEILSICMKISLLLDIELLENEITNGKFSFNNLILTCFKFLM